MENNLEEQNQELNQNLENQITTQVTEESQNQFLQTTLGKTINTAMDLALRAILPDVLEDKVIDIKNTLINNGLKEGIDCAIQSAIDLGKSTMGIVTGKFENLSQAHTAIKNGGIIDSISDVINNVVNQATKNNLISKEVSKFITKGKNTILDTISSNIEEKFFGQLKSLELISKYIENWKNYYHKKDLDGMEKEYKKMQKQIQTIMPLQTTINEAKKIENIHKFLKNKGVDYELSVEEKELVSRLI